MLRRSEDGFVLPMTLVVIAVIGLSLWSAMSVLDGMNRDLLRLTDEVRLETAAQRAEGRLMYMMLTEPFGPSGLTINGRRMSMAESMGMEGGPPGTERPQENLGETRSIENVMRFDGDPYVMPGADLDVPDVVVRVQDEGGLVNLNAIDEIVMTQYLETFGLKNDSARRLAAALGDYVDDDDLLRLNGAERPEYERDELAPPPNQVLRETTEVWHVFGWRDAFTQQQRKRLEETASPALLPTVSNMNTAGLEALMGWFGLTRSEAEKVIKARREAPLIGPDDITRITGKIPPSFDDFRLYSFPSRRVRLRVSLENGANSSRTWETWLTRAEYAADRPYYRGRSRFIQTPETPPGDEKNGDQENDVEPTTFPESERFLPR